MIATVRDYGLTGADSLRATEVGLVEAEWFRPPTLWRWSHVRHHTDTIVVGRDPEIVFPRPSSLRAVLDGVIECPKHNGCFDLSTGEALRFPATEPITLYDVAVRNGRVVSRLASRRQAEAR